MDIEQEKVLAHQPLIQWGNQLKNSSRQQQFHQSELETNASTANQDVEQKKDFIERIFNKSTNFWTNVFCNQRENQHDSRKMSFEINLEKSLEDEEVGFNLFDREQFDAGHDKTDQFLQQDDNEILQDIGEDSQPIYTRNTFQSTNLDGSDSIQDSMYYLDEQNDNDPQNFLDLLPRKSIETQRSDNIDKYQLQNIIDGKMRIRRTNSQNWSVKRKPFGRKEDTIIIDMLKQHGRDFKLIAQQLPGRTEQMVKNRYKSKIRKLLKTQAQSQQKSQTCENSPQTSQQSTQLLQIQKTLKNQFLNESFCSKSNNLEKLQKIKKLQFDIEKIEDLLQTTKSEIIKEYLAILVQKNISIESEQ